MLDTQNLGRTALVAIPLVWITLIILLLIEEVNLGIISLASCDSKIDHEQFRVCARNGVDNDEVEPASRGWHALSRSASAFYLAFIAKLAAAEKTSLH